MAAVSLWLLVFAILGIEASAQTNRVADQSRPDAFVGSKACFGCHSAIYQSFEKTPMGRSTTEASAWTPDLLPPEAKLTHRESGRRFEVLHEEGGWHQKESEPGVFSVEYQLAYAIGSGQNGLTFLIRRGQYLFQAPLSYYSRTKTWDFSPGYEQVDLGFSRQVPEECINCHVGRSSPLPNQPGAFVDPPFQELAIGCENCHGAGSSHIKIHSQAPGKKTLRKEQDMIVNPAKLESRLAENICMNCHQSGDARVVQPGKHFTDFRPGNWLFDTAVIIKQPAQTAEQRESDLLEHYSAMRASRCFQKSNGKLGCLTCHDPHRQVDRSEATGYFRSKCLTCHNEQSCSLSIDARKHQSPPDDCAGCHMPKRDVLQVSHSALTNHRIPARQGEAVPAIPQKEIDDVVVVNAPAGRTIHLSDATLLQAYAQLAAHSPDYQTRYSNLLNRLGATPSKDPVIQAALGNKALTEGKPEEAVQHLLIASQNDPAVNRELGEALAKLGRSEEATQYLKTAAALNPYDAVTQKTLILQYINSKNYTEAKQHMEQYVQTFPDDTFMRNLLARANAGVGQ